MIDMIEKSKKEEKETNKRTDILLGIFLFYLPIIVFCLNDFTNVLTYNILFIYAITSVNIYSIIGVIRSRVFTYYLIESRFTIVLGWVFFDVLVFYHLFY